MWAGIPLQRVTLLKKKTRFVQCEWGFTVIICVVVGGGELVPLLRRSLAL